MAGISNRENLHPMTMRQVSKEISSLIKSPPEGIEVLPSESDLTDIHAIIHGPTGTPYAGGLFKIRLILGKDYPQTPPKGYFLTKIFHPNVSSSGEICVNTLKKDWESSMGIMHILIVIKCLLIVPNPESALNEEAGKLLLEKYDSYCERAKLMTEIHARRRGVAASKKPSEQENDGEPSAKKVAADDKASLEKRKILKEKKRNLKRL
ncbi:unnamed protein product [Notodromas monacha]|uniref:E2 ubiquitin-conjugating enzyme n=1 Tax=Notodromas monacha TaxID=399045 RepID=A0A7R9BEY2_9CRUS|nr:unnamed protein product [Notodromas monacha]CAG0914071.1 unnamed protein product [Notodromas monacha]